VLSTTTFAVRSTVALAAFVNIEKTANDTVVVMVLKNVRVAGGAP